MNAVGLLGSFISKGVYTVSGTFHPFGGAVDIVVVEQPDGSYKSSPWYVRFGKFQGVLKAKEKVVNIIVNGVEANFAMYLDHKGEAYFLREVDDEGEAGLYPSSSGDEAEGKLLQELESRRILGSQSCNYDARSSIDGIEKSKDNGKIVMKTSSRQRILGFVWGRKSIKEESLEDQPVARVDSLERAEIAADLLEVRWSTNLRTQKHEKSDPSKISSIHTSDGKNEEQLNINDGSSIVASTVEGTMKNNLGKDCDTKQITDRSLLALEDTKRSIEVTREISSFNIEDQVVETSIIEEKAFDGTYEVKSTTPDIEQNAKEIVHAMGIIFENADSKSQISLSMNQDSSNRNGENFVGQCISVETNIVPQVSDISEDKSESDVVRSLMFHDGNNLVASTVEGTMGNNLDKDCDTCNKQIINCSQLAMEDTKLSIEVTREISSLNTNDQVVETSIIEEKAFDGTYEVKSATIDIEQNEKDIVHGVGIISENVDSKSQISLSMNQDSSTRNGESFIEQRISVETNTVPQVSDISEDKSESDVVRSLMFHDGNNLVASTVEGTMGNNLDKDCDTCNKQIINCSQLAMEDTELSIEVTREISSLNTNDQVVETSIIEEKAFDGTYEVKSATIDIEQNEKDIVHGVGIISENVDSKSQISLSMNQDSSTRNGESFIEQRISVETNAVPQVSDISKDKSEPDVVRSSMFHDGDNLVASTVEGTMGNNLDKDCDTCTKQITNGSQLALEDTELSTEVTREISSLNTKDQVFETSKDQVFETSIIEEKSFDGTYEVKSTTIDIEQNAKAIVHRVGIISENIDSKSQISLSMNQDSSTKNDENFVGQCLCVETNTVAQVSDISEDKSEPDAVRSCMNQDSSIGNGENFVGRCIFVETNIVPQVSDISIDKSEPDAVRSSIFHDGNYLVASTVEGTMGNNLDKDFDTGNKQITNHSQLALEDTEPSIKVTSEISSLNTKDQVVETSIIDEKAFDETYEVKSTPIDIEQKAKDIFPAVGTISQIEDSKSQISSSMNHDSSTGNEENFIGQCISIERNTVPQVSNISEDKSELDAVRSSMFHDGNNLVASTVEGTMGNNVDKDFDTCNKQITNRSQLLLEDTKPSIEVTSEISSLNSKDQMVETSMIDEKAFDGTYEVKSTPIDIEQNSKDILPAVGIISEIEDSKSQISLSMNQDSFDGNEENFIGQCVSLETNIVPQVSDIFEDKSEPDAVQSSMFHETSKDSMKTLDDTVVLVQRVPDLANGGCGIVGVHTEGLHATDEVHPEGTHSSVIAEEIEIETEKVEVLTNNSQQLDYCETSVYEGNRMDQGKPPTLAQIVSTEEMVGSVKELKSDSIVSSFSSDSQDDKSVDGSFTNKFQNYLNSIGNRDMSKESLIMPSEISDDEQFLFGDFDVSKTEVDGNVELDSQHNNDKEEYPLGYSSSIDEEDRFVHRSYETCTSQDSNEIFSPGIPSPMKIPQSHPVSNIDVQRLAASLPNYHASIDYPNSCEVNHPLSHSLDLNTNSLKLIELCKGNSSCKSSGDGDEKAAEEQSKTEETCVSKELKSSLPNSTVGNPTEASVGPVSNWKLWPFSFKRSSSGKVNQSTVESVKVTQSTVDSGKVTQSTVDFGKVTQSIVDSGKVTQSSVDSGKVTQSTIDSGKVTQSTVDSGKVTQSTVDDYKDFDNKTAPNRNIGMDGEVGILKHKAEKKMVRSISPTSEQLASLNLKEGGNTVTFTFYTSVWGQQQVDARIYLWKWNNRIVISDVDGTITKSDVLGQFMPFVGMDWSQTGVTNLFSAIKENGYQLLFLSARSISQAYHTRQFLFNLKQDGKALPEGPVVISPDGLFPSLYREVIRRAPHEFKIACLERIRELFPPDCNPFYAGFGNRDTDEFSYLKVGIPKGKIFIINPKGEVVVNRRVDTNSYTSLHSLVNGMFPSTTSSEQEDFNSWNYWKLPPSSVDF